MEEQFRITYIGMKSGQILELKGDHVDFVRKAMNYDKKDPETLLIDTLTELYIIRRKDISYVIGKILV